ncbi:MULTISPECIES: carbon-nitrogen family hydrolase [Lactiplantibacillus]|uniref:Carbon-nitrogen family hydrolase n=1 Tax=Lactiplantibacillus pentosus TaxID=1589 RepID=A0AAW8WHA5_LACPE|nr:MULTISPECIES: carbon-nitrogen family hydrolase [Lactiplantibacillus]MBU7460493.1 carbon-nitrogen family hydrolase [Lactiplantibacillus pentosus]MBU7477327.1 carbon-nitrogen family hydrolase [Lactiplantibacillus pentosus]MBU7485253.1 carbon-nitrogen family hydrolase [Lactiplantibacillus sp. 30.2.29]MBU7486576.1 carbon-nitrogen family hydrolase [Lactiplantibacillus pentosus]MBU7499602.1 carbon-nitrogen family hydrolase [Lactiplantibacillus pentosus]
MRVALAQLDIQFGDPDANYQQVEVAIQRAAEQTVDVIVLPEMWNTGYALTRLNVVADDDGQRTRQLLSKLARQFRVNIVGGSVAVARDDHYYNEMLVIDRHGQLVSQYDKVHRFGLMAEDRYITAGATENVFELDDVAAMGVICYDIRFPEWLRKQAAQGPRVIFVSAEWPTQRQMQWRLLLQARSIENQAFVVAVNRVGSDPDNQFGGQSLVIDPLGDLLAIGGAHPQLITATLDLAQVERVRGQIPVFEDRRPELY